MSSDYFTYRILALTLIFVFDSLLILLVLGFGETAFAVIRNHVVFWGMAAAISLLLEPRLTWAVLLPLWILLFLLEPARYPQEWPHVLWAWPLAKNDLVITWVLSIGWAVVGIVCTYLGGKQRRGLAA